MQMEQKKLGRFTRRERSIERIRELDRDGDDFYERLADIIAREAAAFALENRVTLEMVPWKPYGSVTGTEITDLFADEPGRGDGSRVLDFVSALSDAASLSTYLRPSSGRNRHYYERHGFQLDNRNFGVMVRYPALESREHDELLEAHGIGVNQSRPRPGVSH